MESAPPLEASLPGSPQPALDEQLSFGADEFSEDDVLPFLLQAQDMIAKLETRVVDLENDLSVRLFAPFLRLLALEFSA